MQRTHSISALNGLFFPLNTIWMSYLEELAHSLPPHHQGAHAFLYHWGVQGTFCLSNYFVCLYIYLHPSLESATTELFLINQNALDF